MNSTGGNETSAKAKLQQSVKRAVAYSLRSGFMLTMLLLLSIFAFSGRLQADAENLISNITEGPSLSDASGITFKPSFLNEVSYDEERQGDNSHVLFNENEEDDEPASLKRLSIKRPLIGLIGPFITSGAYMASGMAQASCEGDPVLNVPQRHLVLKVFRI